MIERQPLRKEDQRVALTDIDISFKRMYSINSEIGGSSVPGLCNPDYSNPHICVAHKRT